MKSFDCNDTFETQYICPTCQYFFGREGSARSLHLMCLPPWGYAISCQELISVHEIVSQKTTRGNSYQTPNSAKHSNISILGPRAAQIV